MDERHDRHRRMVDRKWASDRKRKPKKRTGHLRSTETTKGESHWKRHDRKKVQYNGEDRTRQDRRRLR
jgi:hypothetical protein